MRVIVLLSNSPKKAMLVKLHTEELVKELKKYLSERKRTKAMNMVLTKGKLEKELYPRDILTTGADLILTKDSANWDLTLKKEEDEI